jgi:hypothetical protein
VRSKFQIAWAARKLAQARNARSGAMEERIEKKFSGRRVKHEIRLNITFAT